MRKLLVIAGVLMLTACTSVVENADRKPDPVAAARDRVAIAAEYLKNGDNEKAISYLKLALKSNPDSAEAHSLMGVVLEREGLFPAAEKSYRKALRLRPKHSQTRNNYGSFLFRRQRYKDAMEQFAAAAEDLSYSYRAQAFEGLGRSAFLAGKKQVALDAMGRALKLDSSLPTATLISAELLFEQKNYEAAHNLYKRYLQLTTNSPQSAQSLWLGIRLERLFGNKDALASYELALKRLYPESPEYRQYQETLKAE